MNLLKDKKKRKIIIILTSIFTILLVLILNVFIYISDYYEAKMEDIEAYTNNIPAEYKILDNGNIIYEVENPIAGLVFYPGGKVEYTAYIPLMETLADKGILCVIVKMPLNLAVLDVNAADGILKLYPEVEKWYIGGHSLGGTIAANYVEKHLDEYEGLILLAAYSTVDLSATNLSIISIYGSEDRVLSYDRYFENKKNLPSTYREIVISGGCHAYFGMYGIQDGDGIPTITNIEQIKLAAESILDMIS